MFDKITKAIKAFLKIKKNEDIGRNNNEQRANGARMADDATGTMAGFGDGIHLRMFEEGLETSCDKHSEHSERNRRQTESERLVNISKRHGVYFPIEATQTFGEKYEKRTGESVVYLNEETMTVTKIKDPFAKSAIKRGVQPEDAVFEHLVHNHIFPETCYTFKGISEEMDEVRIILSQKYISSYRQPTKEQISEDLAKRGLLPEDKYSVGNEFVSITDVCGDNALLDDDDNIYFIDPIIRYKKSLREIIANYI